jgi:cytochrome c peroxidase
MSLLPALLVLLAATSAGGQAGEPSLPDEPFDYVGYAVDRLPDHFTPVLATDNTPVDNPLTNAGATLGRVLFYDVRLSVNDTVSCGSCHLQEHGFSDPRQFSLGHLGDETPRHSMGLANARFYTPGHFRWDATANTLEDQVLIPIEDAAEMGSDLASLEPKLAATAFYPALFQAAFGSPDVTSDRIARAVGQFVRAMVSYQSRYDDAFLAGTGGAPDFSAVFDADELLGLEIFESSASPLSAACDQCHQTVAQVSDTPRNNGLDFLTTDEGAGNGRFKAPSLRNVGVRDGFMHDGRFATLAEVVNFYSSRVRDNADLDPLLRLGDQPGNPPDNPNWAPPQKAALEAFLHTLTDPEFLADEKFSDPFAVPEPSAGLQLLVGAAVLSLARLRRPRPASRQRSPSREPISSASRSATTSWPRAVRWRSIG